MKPFSPSQREAIETFGADIVVGAGAGSGKTSVLVNRFVKAVVERGDAPDRILAITFAEKAANEMKSRLAAEFTRLGREADRRALETAYIGTIHSFCARLLRENPIEAGVDPYFKVLSEGESDILIAETMDAVFEAQVGRPRWLEILVDRGEEKVRRALLRLYEHFRAFGDDERLLAVSNGTDRKILDIRLISELQEAASETSAKPGKNEIAVVEAARLVPGILSRPLTWEAFFQIRQAVASFKKAGRLADWVEAFRADFEKWKCAALEELFAPEKIEFIRVFREFRQAYETQKRLRATLDFDDLPFLAWKLLSEDAPAKQAVRARCLERFRHVFVDEFQDTSPLQAALIDRLRGKGNLFLVGDRRQSIYSFRHAEPALFTRYEAAAGRRIALDENYRSRPALIGFANTFFSEIFTDGTFHALKSAKSFKRKAGGDVELLCVKYGESHGPKNLEEAREAEAVLLGERLRALVESGARVEDGTPEGRPMRWGDAAVLLRKTTKAAVYERAFAGLGIPFYSVKSKGFFERPEVKDLVAFLALLDHPDDDVSLATVLRSPLAGVSDDGLFWLARAAKKNDAERPLSRALDALDAVENLSDEDRRLAAGLRDFAASTRAAKNSLTVSDVIERAIRWSEYEALMMVSPGGAQRVANVRKLVEVARSLEEKTPLDTAEFVRYVRGMADSDRIEAQASIEAQGTDAVLITSIHAAKGLEFPCVAVADLGGRQPFKYDSFEAASIEGGFGWRMKDPENEKESLKDAAFARAEASLKARQDAEEDRLLYVAMTRAEERLLLCGSVEIGDTVKNGSWIARLLAFLKYEDSPSWKPSAGGAPVQVTFASEKKEKTAENRFSAGIRPAEEKIDFDAVLGRLVLPEKTYDLAVDLTVSDVLAAENEPVRRQLAEEPVVSLEIDVEPEEAVTPRNEYGTLFHKAMEVMTRSRSRGQAGEAFLEDLLGPLTPGEKKEMRAQIAAFWKGPTGAAVRKAAVCYPELPFIYKTKFGILKGQIDLVFRTAAGEWIILDYKTNRITPAEKEAVSSGYEFQLALYALVFRQLYGEAPSRGLLYFSTIDDHREYRYAAADFARFESQLDRRYGALARHQSA